MASPFHKTTSEVFALRSVLEKRARRYTACSVHQKAIVDKTILAATSRPDLLLKADIDTALFRLLHRMALRDLNIEARRYSFDSQSGHSGAEENTRTPDIAPLATLLGADAIELLTDMLIVWCRENRRDPSELLPKCDIVLQRFRIGENNTDRLFADL